MALVIIASFVVGCLWIIQAIYTFRTGDSHPFFLQETGAPGLISSTPTAGMFRLAMTYLIPGLAVLGILAFALMKVDRSYMWEWIGTHFQELVFALILIFGGFSFIWRPGIVLKSARSAYPGIDVTRPGVVLVARLIGVGFISMGMFVLAMMRN